MPNEDSILEFSRSAREERPPRMDVTTSVMRTIRAERRQLSFEFERQLRWDAIMAIIMALLVAIPAERAMQSLLDPMISLFGSIEAVL